MLKCSTNYNRNIMAQANLSVGKIFMNNTNPNSTAAKADQGVEAISYEQVMANLRNMRARPAKNLNNSTVPTNVDLMTGEVGYVWRAERGNGRELIVIEKVGENQFQYTTEPKE